MKEMGSIKYALFLLLLTNYSFTRKLDHECSTLIKPDVVAEIESYRAIVNRIIAEAVNGSFKGKTYNRLATFIDYFGNRLAGSENLENAIDSMLKLFSKLGFNNVHGENVTVPYWVRGNESATLLSPRKQKLEMLGLGYSVGTPKEGITAEAVVFDSFNEMDQNSTSVQGKIVIFNERYTSYGDSVIYRSKAASKASRYGALGVLVSSITPFSLNTPHTGMQSYDDDVKQIPVACITPADAHMLRRMQNRGKILRVNMKMDAALFPNSESRNVIADLKGQEMPEKLVIVSGHIDSWDVGQGALDDGSGAFVSWNALALLKKLGLKSRRTIRTILWTGEEEGLIGAAEYFKSLNQSLINIIMESDEGTFKPLGLKVSATIKTACIIKEILNLLSPINATNLELQQSVGSDIQLWVDIGVPGASLWTTEDKYFWYHHSEADTMDALNSEELDLCTATFAAVSYVISDLSIDLPR